MIEIVPIPAFEDNYIWLPRNRTHAVAIDPGDAIPVEEYLQRHGLTLVAVMLTHHHRDHVGGAAELRRCFNVPVYGPRHETISSVTHPVGEGDLIEFPELETTFQVIDVPGHTVGHVAYYQANSLFCGDALFACGCGRLFEGTAQQMYTSLAKFCALPDDTKVYCAHEYTLENIRFAKMVEPCNKELATREHQEREALSQDRPTLPSSIWLEKLTNPFLRCDESAVIAAATRFAGHPLASQLEVFTAIRQWRDQV